MKNGKKSPTELDGLYNRALELFGEMRYLTKEEEQVYNEILSKDFITTEENFFDLL